MIKLNKDKLSIIKAQEEKREHKDKKLEGIEFEGVMCSATFRDQSGLLAIKQYLEHGGASTIFNFENGNKLKITRSNFDSFYTTWSRFRASFFNNINIEEEQS